MHSTAKEKQKAKHLDVGEQTDNGKEPKRCEKAESSATKREPEKRPSSHHGATSDSEAGPDGSGGEGDLSSQCIQPQNPPTTPARALPFPNLKNSQVHSLKRKQQKAGAILTTELW